MAKHNEKGKEGEIIARRYLEQHDYEILETNWRFGHLEADIIAFHDNHIVFVEVKTRRSEEYGEPEDFVDWKKRRAYIKLANAYITQKNREEEARFDIVSVLTDGSDVKVKHLINAYTTIG